MIEQASTNTPCRPAPGVTVYFCYPEGWWGYREATGFTGSTTWRA